MTVRGRVDRLEKGKRNGACGSGAWCERLPPVIVDPGGLLDNSGKPAPTCPRCGRKGLIVEVIGARDELAEDGGEAA